MSVVTRWLSSAVLRTKGIGSAESEATTNDMRKK